MEDDRKMKDDGISIASGRKRQNYLSWEDFYMATALLASKRSKDPECQVGACIVDEERRIVSIGYNGMPIGFNDDFAPWDADKKDPLKCKLNYVCHAELNAIGLCKSDVKGCTLYVNRFPCNECTKLIIQSGIKEVVYLYEKTNNGDCRLDCKISKIMVHFTRVGFRQYKPQNQSKIEIDMMKIPPWEKEN